MRKLLIAVCGAAVLALGAFAGLAVAGTGNGNGHQDAGPVNVCEPGMHAEGDTCVHNGDGAGNCGQNQSGKGGDHGFGHSDACGSTPDSTTTTSDTTTTGGSDESNHTGGDGTPVETTAGDAEPKHETTTTTTTTPPADEPVRAPEQSAAPESPVAPAEASREPASSSSPQETAVEASSTTATTATTTPVAQPKPGALLPPTIAKAHAKPVALHATKHHKQTRTLAAAHTQHKQHVSKSTQALLATAKAPRQAPYTK
jgi:hypothetical protein